MNFYIVFSKSRKKIDKYMKVNMIRHKSLIDIELLMHEHDIKNDIFRDYFNLLVLARIAQAIKKGKDIYYIPNFKTKFSIEDILNIKKNINNENINFNILMFYDEFREDDNICTDVLNNLSKFNISQIIKDY